MRFYRYIILFLVPVIFLVGSCKDKPEAKVSTRKISFEKEGELQLKKAASDSIITTLDIEIADSDYERQTGLMYRTSMAEKQGMLFIFESEALHSFYMKNTLIPLDIIYINKDLAIESIVKNAEPANETSLPSRAPVQYVLEVNGGLSDRWGLEIGDRISFSRLNSDD